MTTERRDEGIPVEMTMLQWHHIDGTVDNEVSNAAEDGRDDLVEAGHAIRQAGWDQIPKAPGTRDWPPNDTRVTVSMSRAQWSYAIHVCDYWEIISREMDPEEDQEFWPALRRLITAEVGDEPAPWHFDV